MGKAVTIDLDPALLADYESAAGEHGRSLEAELAEALATVRPKPRLSPDKLVALVREIGRECRWLRRRSIVLR